MEPNGDCTLVQEIPDTHADGSQTACGLVLSNSSMADRKSSTPDIGTIVKDKNYSSLVNSNKNSSLGNSNNVYHKLCTTVLLFCATVFVIGVMQIPISLFYTDPPSATIEINHIADFESCQVITHYITARAPKAVVACVYYDI